jgi:hypothetical protein
MSDNETVCAVLTAVELAILRVRDKVDVNIADNYTLLDELSKEVHSLCLMRERQ